MSIDFNNIHTDKSTTTLATYDGKHSNYTPWFQQISADSIRAGLAVASEVLSLDQYVAKLLGRSPYLHLPYPWPPIVIPAELPAAEVVAHKVREVKKYTD